MPGVRFRLFVRIGGRTLPRQEGTHPPHEGVGKMRRTILFTAILFIVSFALRLSSCDGDEGKPTGTSTSAPSSATGSASPSPSGFALEDLVGTWTSDYIVEPAWPALWSWRITIEQCDPGELCGSFRGVIREGGGKASGFAGSCGGDLIYDRTEGTAIVFQESVTYNRGNHRPCVNSQVFLTPMQSGITLGAEEY